MRFLGTCILLCCSLSAIKAQNQAYFNSDLEFNSNSITNSFVNKWLAGGYISEEIKDNVSDKLKPSNRAGLNASFELGASLQKENKTGYTFGIKSRSLLGIKFNEDLFELYFRGNSPYAGEELKIGMLNTIAISYQSFYGGIILPVNEKLYITTSIGLYRGTNYNSINMTKGDFFTELDGTSISLTANPQVNYSNGPAIGVGLNFKADYELNEKQKICFSAADIGFISWKDITNYEADSSWVFEGADIDNILTFDGSEYEDVRTDSVTSILGINKNSIDKSSNLGGKINIAHVYENDDYYIKNQVSLMMLPGYSPRYDLYLNKKFGSALSAGLNLRLGGFGNSNFGLCGKFENDKIGFFANIIYLENLIASNNTTGQAFNVKCFLKI